MFERIKKLFSRSVEVNPLHDPPAIATTLTVSRLHDILDAARNGDMEQLFALYRDVLLSHSHIQAEFSKRKLAVIGDECVIQPTNPESAEDVKAAKLLESELFNVSGWMDSCVHSLDSTLWPVSIVEKVFEPRSSGPLRYGLKELRPVPHHLIDFRSGTLRIFDVEETTGRPLRTSQMADPDRYIIHRGHMLSTPDTHGGPMRSILFWYLFSSLGRDWCARFLERLGSPILIGKYPAGDDEARRIVKLAISAFNRTHGLAVTDSTTIEMVQAGAATSSNHIDFVTFCNREISKLILGQTLSADAQSTGLGSGVATAQAEVRRDVRRLDGLRLANTYRQQLIEQLCEINGLRGRGLIRWIEDTDEDAARYVKTLVDIKNAGLELDDDSIGSVSRKIGLKVRRAAPEVGATRLPFLA